MENYRNLTACGLEFLDDPVLKTTATNYDFKYVPGDQFQRVIRTVQRDRLKQKKDSIWAEFCKTKVRPSIVNAKGDNTSSKYEMKPRQKSREVVRTKASTIKIISQPMVESNIDVHKSASPEESYRTYKPPKVRIMTDDEIKNVVESAFKEVIEQTGNSKVVSQLQTSREPKKKNETLSADAIVEETEKNSPELELDGNKTPMSARSMKSAQSDRTIKSMSEEQTVPDINLLKLAEKLEPSRTLKTPDKTLKLSARSPTSGLSDQSYYEDGDQCVKEAILSARSEEQIVEDIDNDMDNYKKKIPDIQFIPELTCFEKEEFRKFLGVEEFILNPEINLNRFDEHLSSSSEDDDDQKVAEQNISPLIHIRQPTPKSASEMIKGDVLGPIQSSPSIAQKVASPKVNTSKKPTPLKDPTPRHREISPMKSPIKPSRVTSSRSVHSVKKPQTPRSPKKMKVPKSPGSSFKQQNEMKQANDELISKIKIYIMRISDAFDKISATLEDVPEPDGPIDLKRREKRGDEFIGRFSRNYLYQIGRLIEDVRIIPKEQYLGGSDGELAMKASNLFSTLCQAVQCYLKNMSSFIIDQSPKKLATLTDAVSEATKMCVHKKIFEKSDSRVQDILRKTKALKAFLTEALNNAANEPLPKQKQKSKTAKTVKNGPKAATEPKKLSMYDCLPSSTSGVKHKTYPLKGTARSKTSVRSLATKASCESAVVSKGAKKIAEKASVVRISSKKAISQTTNLIKVPRTCKDDVFPIKSPRIDQVTTFIETVQNDDYQDELMLETNENLLKNVVGDTNDGHMQESKQLEDRRLALNNTVIHALESITQQQVEQILGPIVSNFEDAVTTKAGGAGVDVNTILNLIASHLGSVGGVGSAGLSAGSGDTFKQQNQEGNYFNNELQCDTGALFNAGSAYDNNANCERELAVQNQPRLDEPHSRAAPAPNTFPTGELDNLVTSSQQPTVTTAMSQDPDGEGVEGSQPLDSGSRTLARTRDGVEGNATSRSGGSDLGATKSEVETQKVQRVRCDRNVQFTFVTENEDDQAINKYLQANMNIQNPAEKEQNPPDAEVDNQWITKLLEDRVHFITQITESPLYNNENFGQPWKIVSKIANQIVDDAINNVERSISFGEETFVRDFIQMELQS